MRLLLKTRDCMVKLYWVEPTFNGVIGWCLGESIRIALNIPENSGFDSHFLYPEDGDYHFSYKYKQANHEEYTSVYWDRIKIKTIENGERAVTEKRRDELINSVLSIMVPAFKPKPLWDVDFFLFPTLGCSVHDGLFGVAKNYTVVQERGIKEDDVVVDASGLTNSILNIHAFLRAPETKSVIIRPHAERFSKTKELQNSRLLDLVCDISPNS